MTQRRPVPSSISKAPTPITANEFTTRPATVISLPRKRPGSRLIDWILSRGGQAANNSVPATTIAIAAILGKLDELRVTIFLRCRRNRIILNPDTDEKFFEK